MNPNAIAFPNLGIYLDNVPKTIMIGNFSIAYYGIILSSGILFGFILAAYLAKDRGLSEDIVWDFAVPAIFFSIVCARIYYVATSWEKYKDDVLSIFNLRQGGIGVYGSIIGAFLTMYVFTKIKKISYFAFADTIIAGLPLGQLIGRWGNFMNREAFGGYYDGLFAMKLPIAAVRVSDISEGIAAHITEGVDYILVHPTFLYESVWNLGVLIVLLCYRKKKKFEGELTLLYFLLYGVGRFFIENLRTDQLFIPGTNIPISMAVGAVSAVVSLILIFVGRRFCKQSTYKLA